jgi:hypothetical protein
MAEAAKIPHSGGVGNALFVKICDEIFKVRLTQRAQRTQGKGFGTAG